MIVAWRLLKARHAVNAFSGEGGLHAPGRWHRQGDRIVYTASSLALAALEVLVHLGRADAKIRFVAFRVEIPPTVRVIEAPGALPRDWRAEPPGEETMAVGSAWLRGGASAVFKVPSAIVPVEHNYLLNPAHPDFVKLGVDPPEAFTFDARLWMA